jgi:hypothetical protein
VSPGGTPDLVDTEAELAVITMEADPARHAGDLETLDRSIRAAGPIGERILADDRMRHQARVSHWRQSNPLPVRTDVEANR